MLIYYSSTTHLLLIYYSFTSHLLLIYYSCTSHVLLIYHSSTTHLLLIYYSSPSHLLLERRISLRQPLDRRRLAPNVRAMGKTAKKRRKTAKKRYREKRRKNVTGKNGTTYMPGKTAKKRYLLLILVPTTHIPHTHFGTHLVWVTKLSNLSQETLETLSR